VDSFILTGPQGTSVNIGSYVRPDGIDFGSKDLLKAQYGENAFSEGGVYGFEDVGVRTMTFPMLLPSSSAFTGGLTGLEALIRNTARPGAYIDLIPDGVATADAVRFDVLAGRLEDEYSGYHQRVTKRQTTLKLDVQPFGYLPTFITLASVASVALPGVVSIPNASIIGDAPGLTEITIAPSSPTSYPIGTWPLDMLAWSLGGRASFKSFWPAASLASAISGSLIGDLFAPASQAVGVFPAPTLGAWTHVAFADIPASLEPAYRGRFRLFTWANLSASQANGWSMAADIMPAGNVGAALASSGRVATLAPDVRGAQVAAASPAYSLLDLGELTLPPLGSGIAQPLRIRLWTDVGGTNAGIASPMLTIGGLFLLPVDGPAGILTRGLAQPSIAPIGSVGRLNLSGIRGDAFIGAATGDIGSYAPLGDARVYYRGAMPKVGGSTLQLDLLAANRRMGADAYLDDEAMANNLLAYYRGNDPAGASNIAPLSGYGATGIATGASMGQPGPLWGGPADRAINFTGSSNSWGFATVGMPTSLTAFVIARRASAVASGQALIGGGSAPQGWAILYSSNILFFQLGPANASGPSLPNVDASYHSYAMTIDGATAPFAVRGYYDGSCVASAQIGSWGGGTQMLSFSAVRGFGGSLPFPGLLSKVLVIGTSLGSAQVKQLHDAAFSPTSNATTPIVRASEAFAAVSVRYRPRFQFLKGI
jgi:hypothetical protein